ncbi:hypothetical protein [Nocardia sp. NPDC004722]
MSSPRSRRAAVAFLVVIALVMAGIAAALLINGTRDLTQPTSCGGVVMSERDGCEVMPRGGRGSPEIQVYWPGGMVAGIAHAVPADRPLRSRDQMHDKARTDGIVGVLVGTALLLGLIVLGRKIIRRWPRNGAQAR